MPVLMPGIAIFTSTAGSTSATGSWYTIPPGYDNLTWQAVLTNSSVGATASSTVGIQVSNTTAVAVSTAVQTMGLTCTTDTVASGGVLAGSTMQGAWKYVRVVMTSLTTSTAGSAGSPAVNVYANVSF